MKVKLLKKSVSLLLVLCMILSYLPGTVFASTGTNDSFGKAEGFYKVVHLDAGRKYISVENIKKYIDAMAQEGYNQLTLYFSDNQGFRFKLDDMSLEVNGTDYTSDITAAVGNGYNQPADGVGTGDWFRHSLEADGTKNYLDESDMKTIISYANSKGIDLVPAFDMPGHMGAILEVANLQKFRYTGSTTTSWSTLNVDDANARAFALALLQKYVDFFAEQGCDYFSICADEFCYDTGSGNIKSSSKANIMLFMDEAAKIIDNAGMIPRCFNDWMYVDSSYTPSSSYAKYEVYFWGDRGNASLATIQSYGHPIINTGEAAYYALGSNWYSESGTTDPGVKAFDPYVIATKGASFPISNPAGVCFAIWCDRGYFDTNTAANTGAASEPAGGDGGTILFAETEGYLRLFAQSVRERGPKEKTINLLVGQTADVTLVVNGYKTNDQLKELYNFGSVLDIASSVQSGSNSVSISASPATSLATGDTVAIGDGTYYLKWDGSSLTATKDTTEATVWTVEKHESAANYRFKPSANASQYLDMNTIGLGSHSWGSSNNAQFEINNNLLKQVWGGNYIGISDTGVISSSGSGDGVSAFTASASTATTTFTFKGVAAGTVNFTAPDGTQYTVNVAANEHTCNSNVAATCVKGASCSICGEAQNDILDANNHVGGTVIKNASATYTGDECCASCGHVFVYGDTLVTKQNGNITVSAWNEASFTATEVTQDYASFISGATKTVAYDIVLSYTKTPADLSATVTLPVAENVATVTPFMVDNGEVKTLGTANVSGGYVSFEVPHFTVVGYAVAPVLAEGDIAISVTAGSSKDSDAIDGQLAEDGATGNVATGLTYTVDVTENTTTSGGSVDYPEWTNWDAAANNWHTYTTGERVVYNGYVWECIVADSGTWTPEGMPAYWTKLGPVSDFSGTGGTTTTTYTTVVTFTAASGMLNGVYETTIGGQKFVITVTGGSTPDIEEPECTHNYELVQNSSTFVHYYECSLCHDTYGEEACYGGTANCYNRAKCTVCGKSHGETDPDNHKEPWTLDGYGSSLEQYKDYTINAKEATATEDGYTGDICCGWCSVTDGVDHIRTYGTVIPATGSGEATEFVTVEVGATATLELDGTIGTDDASGTTKNGRASYVVKHNASASYLEFSWTTTYNPGDLVAFQGHVYKFIQANAGQANNNLPGVDGKNASWEYVGVEGTGGEATTTITFTGVTAGTDTVTIGSTVISVTVTEPCDHNWEQKYDSANHWQECSVCHDKKDIQGHTGGTANCYNRKHCTVCGQGYGERDLNNHKEPWTAEEYGSELEQYKDYIINAAEATDTANGYTGDICCGWCSVTDGVDRIRTYGTVIPSTGTPECSHNWVAGYNDTHHYEECSLCHAKRNEATHAAGVGNCVEAAYCTCGKMVAAVDPNAHKSGTDVLKGYVAATASTDGYTGDYHCQHCDAIKVKGEVIPALGAITYQITVAIGENTELVLSGHVGTNGATGNTDNSKASYVIAHTTGASDIPAWDNTAEYWADDEVIYNGNLYKANWWSRGTAPGGTGGDWTYISPAPAAGDITTITFTGVSEGTDTVTIDTTAITVNVTNETCEHVWEVKTDTNYHWNECSNCHEIRDKALHTGGTANCKDQAICVACYKAYGAVDSSNHKGPMVEVSGSYVAPGDYTDGKEADIKCSACGHITTGAMIPALQIKNEVITVATGNSVQKVLPGFDFSDWQGTENNPNTSIANVSVTHTPEQPVSIGTAQTGTLSNGMKVVIGNGTHFLVWDGTTLSTTTDKNLATAWTVELNSSNASHVRFNYNDLHLNIDNLTVDGTAWGNGAAQFNLEGTTLVRPWSTKYFNIDANGVLSASATSGGVGAYAYTGGTDQFSTVTFTGVTPGTTYATVGNTRYTINVVDAALMNASLQVGTWMTNREVSGFLNADGTNSSFDRIIYGADHVNMTTEKGVALKEIIPGEATTVDGSTTASHAIFWRGMLHAPGEHQGTNGKDFHLYGKIVNYIRYYNDVWQGSADQNNWFDLSLEGYKLDLYYLQETAVTKEVITEVVDWGPDYDKFTADQWESATYVLLDFAVAMDGVGRKPILSAFPNNGDGSTTQNQKTIAFHCVNDLTDAKIYQDTASGRFYRRIDGIYAQETSEYEVYMITVTRTNDTPTTTLGAAYSPEVASYTYEGAEKIIWTVDEKTYNEKVGQTTTDGKVLGAYDLQPADFDITNDAAKATMYRTVGGDPYVDYVQIFQNQGLLVTYYVRAKKTEDSLTVHYRLEGSDSDIHNYYIAVEGGTFFDPGFDNDPYSETGLKNNTITEFYGNEHTVNSDLSKLFDVPSQYRTGLYDFNEHIDFILVDGTKVNQEDYDESMGEIKEVIMYYGVDNIHYVPVDFGHHLTITTDFFDHHVSDNFTINSVSLPRTMSGYNYTYGVIKPNSPVAGQHTYVPQKIMNGAEQPIQFNLELTDKETGTISTETHYIVFFPATTVYYEDFFVWYNNFATGNCMPYHNGVSGKVDYETDHQEDVCHKDTKVYNYGHDDGINQEASAPSHNSEIVMNDTSSYITFTFTGTGIEIYANSTKNTANAAVMLFNGTGTSSLRKLYVVDTRLKNGDTPATGNLEALGAAYNVPIVSVTDLPYGTYTVRVGYINAREPRADGFRFDGFRVFQPMEETAVLGTNVTVGLVYSNHHEQTPSFFELRDAVMAQVTIPEGYNGDYANQIGAAIEHQVNASGKGVNAVILNGNAVTGTTGDNIVVDILDNSAKNEIYLQPQQTLVFQVSDAGSLQLGMKAVNGATSVDYFVDGQNGPTEDSRTINSTTNMFYTVGYGSGSNGSELPGDTVVVTNSGSNVLSVTLLKVVPIVEAQRPKMMMLSARSYTSAAMALGYKQQNGIFEENGKKYWYVDGEKTYGGLMLIDGDYYYARTSGEIVCGRSYWVIKTNGLLPAAMYTFDEDGKMINSPAQLEDGITEINGTKYWVLNGKKTYGGLIQIDGNYYYARTSGKLVCNRYYWVAKTNGLLPSAVYFFDEDGKMVNPPIVDGAEAKNGIVTAKNGKMYYYENGVKTYGGLMLIDGEYYYANISGEIVSGRDYWITKTNGLMAVGKYTFDATGKLVN